MSRLERIHHPLAKFDGDLDVAFTHDGRWYQLPSSLIFVWRRDLKIKTSGGIVQHAIDAGYIWMRDPAHPDGVLHLFAEVP